LTYGGEGRARRGELTAGRIWPAADGGGGAPRGGGRGGCWEATQRGRLAACTVGTLTAGAAAGARSLDAGVAADERGRRCLGEEERRAAYVLNHGATTFSAVHTWLGAMGHGVVGQYHDAFPFGALCF
jgi:hypothetical protein